MYMYGRDQEDHERRIREAEDREKRAFTDEEIKEAHKACFGDSKAFDLDYSGDSKDTIKVNDEARYIVKSDYITEHNRVMREVADGKTVIEVSAGYLAGGAIQIKPVEEAKIDFQSLIEKYMRNVIVREGVAGIPIEKEWFEGEISNSEYEYLTCLYDKIKGK